MNNSGKALTIFLVIIAVLLVCLTGISAFFFLKEVELRKTAEQNFQQAQLSQAKLEGELKAAQQQQFLLEEKYKEAKENLDSLQNDLDFANSVKQKTQQQNESLAAAVEKLTKEKEELSAQLVKAQDEASSLKADLDAAKLQTREMQNQAQASSEDNSIAPAATQEDAPAPTKAPLLQESDEISQDKNKVNLNTIVVASANEKQGKVISVDADTGFLIANLGEKDGVSRGVILSVYRDKSYLGDVQVSRVLPEMSAADFIPPLNGQLVSKDDQVIVKK
jgi:DNA repair exonuclease SbcCD ATPase subunit